MTLHLTGKTAKDGAGSAIVGGVNMNDESGANAGPFDLVHVLIDSTQKEILGTQADAADTHTDATAVSAMSVWKQISKTLQAAVASAAGALFAKITDGTSTAAVKAASTVPLATDPALVVAISPNSVNPNGPAAMAASAPVTIASNQSTLAVALDTSQVANGATGANLVPSRAAATASASGATTVAALVASKKIRILAAFVSANGAVNFNFQSHATTSNKTGLTFCAAAGDGMVLPFNPLGWFDTAAGEALDINLSAAVAVDGYVVYVAV